VVFVNNNHDARTLFGHFHPQHDVHIIPSYLKLTFFKERASTFVRPWKDHFKSDFRSDQVHRQKNDLRSDQEYFFFKK
jgi:hypothetical protein